MSELSMQLISVGAATIPQPPEFILLKAFLQLDTAQICLYFLAQSLRRLFFCFIRAHTTSFFAIILATLLDPFNTVILIKDGSCAARRN